MLTRLGRNCFRFRWWVVCAWAAIVVVGGIAVGSVLVGTSTARPIQDMESDAGIQAILAEGDHGTSFIAVVEGIDPRAPAVTQAIDKAVSDVRAIAHVKSAGPLITGQDGRGVAVPVAVERIDRKAQPAVMTAAEQRLRELGSQIPGASVRIGGADVVAQQANAASQADLAHAESLALPITLIVLILVFAGIVAALLPLIASLATMLGAFAALFVFTLFVQMDNTVLSVATLLSLGLSIDYGLLLVSRFREELAAGHDRETAVGRTWRAAGTTILYSSLTVVVSLVGLLAFQMPRLQAIGAAGVSAALLAMLAALTLTPALLGLVGRWVKPSKRAVARMRAAQDRPAEDLERGFFARLAGFTQRRPLLVTVVVAAVLVGMAVPAAGMAVELPEIAGLPPTLESVRVDGVLHDNYGVTTEPAVQVVARTSPDRLDAWVAGWQADPEVAQVHPAASEGGGLSSVVMDVHGDDQAPAARDLVGRLREQRPEGVQSWVSGDSAVLVDLLGRTAAGVPWAVLITLAAMIVLLFLMTGSLLVPLKAVAMNLLSLGATVGVLTLLFQHGALARPLGVLVQTGISPYLLVTVFAFGFGFSMDYEMFLLSRIKEFHDAGQRTDVAVRHGLQRSGRIVTSAALLMLVVFACFGAARLADIQELGIGLFVAVLIDAAIVRCLLVPATMTLLGKWNWWAPGPLRRLHAHFGLSEHGDDNPDPRELSRVS
jgi:RND superfamily putative drug exporter